MVVDSLILCCHEQQRGMSIADKIALAGLGLAIFLCLYQLRKDRQGELRAIELHNQNIKLQWFKDLIIHPRLKKVDEFYESLYSIKSKINSSISNGVIINSIELAQNEFSNSFIGILSAIDDKRLSIKIDRDVNTLVRELALVINDPSINLKEVEIYERRILTKIRDSHRDLITDIYNYKGV